MNKHEQKYIMIYIIIKNHKPVKCQSINVIICDLITQRLNA